MCLFLSVSACKNEDPYDPYANFDWAAQAVWEDDVIKKYLDSEKITNFTRTPSGLYYVLLEEGTGPKPQVGQTVEVHYVGYTVLDKYMFDSSYKRGQTLPVTLGKRQVIPGWEEGLALMKEGEKALLLIPSPLAYGRAGSGGVIAPNVPIMFEVHLLDVK